MRCTVAALLLVACHLCAAAEGDVCQALGFTGPVCSDCDMLASYVKDDGVLLCMLLQLLLKACLPRVRYCANAM